MSWWWDGNYGFQVYSNESLENNPQSSGGQGVNQEEVSTDVYSNQRVRLAYLNEPLSNSDFLYGEPSYQTQPTDDFVYGEVSYPTQHYDDFVYAGEQSYPTKYTDEFAYAGEKSYPTQHTDDFVYVGELSYPTQQTDDFVYAGNKPANKSEDEEQTHATVSYKTDQNFQSREHLVDWVVRRGRDNGYVIVIRRSRRKGDDPSAPVIKVWLVCDRHGERTSTATIRRVGSKKRGCPFKLEGVYDENIGYWKLTVIDGSHNHDPSLHIEEHAFARKLSKSEQLLVAKLYSQNMLPRNILATISEQNPESRCIKKDIYNLIQKIKNEMRVGETPMQVLEHLLSSKGYVYYTREDNGKTIMTTNA
ncbi:hypothetical protein L1987_01020 [Smallanthus sonchifolius]|uniref:Uncharacterized protein n=1 Tax=Smallanthus sonchifolius TaxID=185202 RepID=A0ACB9K439_9ASTR|nr:hypothetical protein L1987_01020 [Smallanthus sonchifolius]